MPAQGRLRFLLFGDVLRGSMPVDNLAGGVPADISLYGDNPHFAIPADNAVHIVLFNIGCIKHPDVVRMHELTQILFPGLECAFPGNARAENGVELIGEFEAVFLRMIFPRPEMRQLRRQRKHFPVISQRLRHRFVFGDVLIDPVPLLDIARFIFDYIDPDGNGADFAIPPDDAMFKGTRSVKFGALQYFLYFRSDHGRVIGMHKIPGVFRRRHERPFPRHRRGINRIKHVVKLEHFFIIMIAPRAQVGHGRRAREQLPAVARSRFHLPELLRQMPVTVAPAPTPADEHSQQACPQGAGIENVSIHVCKYPPEYPCTFNRRRSLPQLGEAPCTYNITHYCLGSLFASVKNRRHCRNA